MNNDEIIYEWQGNKILEDDTKNLQAKHKKACIIYKHRLEKYLPKNKNALIYDIPCGDGNILYFLKVMGFENIQGYDISAGRVAKAKELGLSAFVSDVFDVLNESDDKSVNIIFSVDFIEHLEKDDAIKYLKLANKKLSNNGTLILRAPVTDSIYGGLHFHNDFTHKWAVNTGVWRSIANISGFERLNIFDERPDGPGLWGLVKRLSFRIASKPICIQRKMLGGSIPTIWSPSAWIILQK